MDALPSIIEMLSLSSLKDFLTDNAPIFVNYLGLLADELNKVQIFMKRKSFIVHPDPEDEKQALVEALRLTARKVGNFRKKIEHAYKKQLSIFRIDDLVKDWKETIDFITGIVVFCNYLKQKVAEDELEEQNIDAVVNPFDDINSIETLLLGAVDNSKIVNGITQNEDKSQALLMKVFPALGELNDKSQALLLVKAFPALGKLNESSEIQYFLSELSKELDNLPKQICKACERQPLALILVGSLLSLRQRTYDTWNTVKDDLGRIKESNKHVTGNHMWHMFSYCYDDLPYFLKPCFLYLSCYLISYEIPAGSLTEIWIAEGFVTPEKGETREETADKYLEQLVQRSLVYVSKRSMLGTIKYCRVLPSLHEFIIEKSYKDGFLVANPDKEMMESLFRLAIHHDNKKQYTEVENNHIHSFLAFDFNRNVIGSAVFLRVLELRKSVIPVTVLSSMTYLRYLGMRRSNISELPDLGDFKYLQTLDVRDTDVKILPESLWKIATLRHVYASPSPQIVGPPAESNITDLQTLKTVAVPESWLDIIPLNKIPNFYSTLRKIALLIRNDSDLRTVSNILSHSVNLLSLAITGKTIPSEFADTRAFPNLETVKSIKLEGQWNCRKLFIDNVKFPPKLTKLTLISSGLKEDPMPRLEKLQALKFLSLKDGAYIGKQIVCTENGFPQLQFLELYKLKNLESWLVDPTAMSHLTKLHVAQCTKLINNLPPLTHVTDKVID